VQAAACRSACLGRVENSSTAITPIIGSTSAANARAPRDRPLSHELHCATVFLLLTPTTYSHHCRSLPREPGDFFTSDVAYQIVGRQQQPDFESVLRRHPASLAPSSCGLSEPFCISPYDSNTVGESNLAAALLRAAESNRYTSGERERVTFLTEVSMDRPLPPQSPRTPPEPRSARRCRRAARDHRTNTFQAASTRAGRTYVGILGSRS